MWRSVFNRSVLFLHRLMHSTTHTPSERGTAQNAAASARQLRINAELNWEVARAQLALALGRLTGAQPLNADSSLP
jgi:hypothetical protein